jgi:hypothetical protein
MTPTDLPEFHPRTVLRDWGNGDAFRISDALTGVSVFGATGSGKTSGPAKHLAYGYLAADFGGLVLCAKKEERIQWQQWAAETGRSNDLIIFDLSGKWRFNFLDWECKRSGEGAGLTINIVNLIDEIAAAIATDVDSKGDSGKFWQDALHHMNMNLVDLALMAKLEISLPLMREIVISAPRRLLDTTDNDWLQNSPCGYAIKEAKNCLAESDKAVAEDYAQVRSYWFAEHLHLAEKTRSIIELTFSILARPFTTRPLRKLFANTEESTNVTPEDTFKGKIIVIDLPVQEFRLAGRLANFVWKYCFQIAVLRRMQPQGRNHFLRPVFLWADEAQNFISKFDAEYQAVARSAGGCTVYLTQNRESYLRVLQSEAAVDSLLGNLQAKFFCQNSGGTSEWAAKLLGERWINTTSTNVGNSSGTGSGQQGSQGHQSSGVTVSEQRRYFVEPARFTTLKRGGEAHNFRVESIVYNGGHQFASPTTGREAYQPFKLLTFNQR